jgi:hypothetical protein
VLHFGGTGIDQKEADTVLLHKAEERCGLDHMYLFQSFAALQSQFEPQLGYVKS